MNQSFYIVIFSENNVGLIVRIMSMISRRRIHIEGLRVESCLNEGLYKFTLLINETEATMSKLMLQIDKQVDVYKSFFGTDEASVLKQQELYFNRYLAQAKELTENQILQESIV